MVSCHQAGAGQFIQCIVSANILCNVDQLVTIAEGRGMYSSGLTVDVLRVEQSADQARDLAGCNAGLIELNTSGLHDLDLTIDAGHASRTAGGTPPAGWLFDGMA